MRPGCIVAALVLSAGVAYAKPGPAPELRLTPSAAEHAIAVDALGATLESDYFRGPSRRVSSSGGTCRMVFDPFDKERLAANCR